MTIGNEELMHKYLPIFPNTCAWQQQEWNKTDKIDAWAWNDGKK